MKRNLFLTVIGILLLLKNITAQVDTSTTQKLLQYIMQPLDKNQIPTGFLEEYGSPMLPMATFNGTLTDSNRIDMHLWRTLYFQLQTGWAKSTSNPLSAITTVNSTIKNSSGDTILIPLLIGSYNTVKSNAFSANLLSYNSNTNQIHDVQGRSESPYNTNNLFAASPVRKETIRGTEIFIIKSNAIWNNTGKTISSLQVDFADGEGFQNVSIGTPVTISYTDTGYKRWTIKATLNDNSILQCYNDYHVLKATSGSARYEIEQSDIPIWGFVDPVAGVHSGAEIWVNFSNLNRTNTLRKPLIVVEGYDVNFRAPLLQPFNYDIEDFINGINEPRLQFDFNSQLDDIAGYDLVFVDFNDGADDIVRNAAIVQEVINRVNANKVNDDRFGNIRQQNVVMGLSMGGLCARYALANMTKNFSGTPTETRLLITHDSPHKGANVPLGLQYMIRMMGELQLFGTGVRDIFPDYDDAIGLLNAPATQQLLLYRAATANTFTNNTFLDATYRPMITFNSTDPQPTYRFIATANGNECANPLFNPGKTFINLGAGVSAGIYGRLLFFRVPILTYKLAAEVEAYALPNSGSTNKIARVYTINNLKLFGFINIVKQLYNNTAYAPGNHLPVDGVPGSTSPLLDVEALNEITNLPVFAASLYVSFPLGPFLGGYFGVYAYNAGVSINFTFVPVGSALDVSPYNNNVFSQKYVNGTNQNFPSSSETFIAQETVQNNPLVSNNVHMRFTARNAQWLYNEMENLNNNLNCSNECSNPYYISGSSIICSTQNFVIPGLQRGATVTWTASPTGIVAPIANGNPATVNKLSNGTITLTAYINNACGIGQIVVNKQNIVVGVPSANINIYPLYSSQYCTNSFGNTFTILPNNPGETFQWGYSSYQNNIPPTVTNQNGSSEESFIFYLGGNYQIFSNSMNACGMGALATLDIFVSDNCNGGFGRFAASPNPTTGDVQIEALATDKSSVIKEIQVTDKFGNLKKIINLGLATKKTTINISELPVGIYFIRVYDGKSWTNLKVIKN